MSQKQLVIPLSGLDGKERTAVATGNNAAWLCLCRRSLPLIGKSGDPKGPSEGTKIQCPDCNRTFFVVPKTTNLTSAVEVQQLLSK